MNSTQPLSRTTFDALMGKCAAIFLQYGFSPHHRDSRFDKIFEETCFGFFGEVEPKQSTTPPKRNTVLTQKQMDQMTLECAIAFAQAGVEGVHYNEGLNFIRSAIADVLEVMGYGNFDLLCHASQPGWGCYRLWEDMARQAGLSEKEIAETRDWYKKNRPGRYKSM